MMTVNEVSRLTGVSVRTLHYYDQIGLLAPSEVTAAGYRLYNNDALAKLQQILLFRELQFPLSDIGRILGKPDFDKNKALEQQISLLTLKKERLENLIVFAREILTKGESAMDFKAFDSSKIDEYTKQAKEKWGDTAAYKEFEVKTANQSKNEQISAADQLMVLFSEFGTLMNQSPDSAEPQAQVKKLQDFISTHFYTCTNEILSGLGQMYACGGEFTQNIDRAGGCGCADFVAKAINIFCAR